MLNSCDRWQGCSQHDPLSSQRGRSSLHRATTHPCFPALASSLIASTYFLQGHHLVLNNLDSIHSGPCRVWYFSSTDSGSTQKTENSLDRDAHAWTTTYEIQSLVWQVLRPTNAMHCNDGPPWYVPCFAACAPSAYKCAHSTTFWQSLPNLIKVAR